MDCRRREREGTHSNPLNFVGEVPKFFKIVVNPRDNRLRLPTEFVKRYGQSLPNRVFLNVPNGYVQEVELIQINGETWLQRGWQEFKEKYSIGFGHVLLFEYDCNFDFNVYIFDTTALEIEYPLDSSAAYNEGINLEKALITENNSESETDNSVVFLGKCLPSLCDKGKRKIFLQADQTENDVSAEILDSPVSRWDKRRTRSKTDDSVEFSDDPPVRKSSSRMQNLLSHSKYYNLRVRGSSPSPNYQSEHTRVKLEGSGGQATERARRVLNKETCISYQRAKAFKSDNPSRNPFYISVLLPSAIHPPCILSIPFLFARENLPRPHNNIKLSVYDGKTWPVRCTLQPAKIRAGWSGFVKSNALKVGDTCIFEVNKRNKLVWNVIIFHC